jgi:hypothetical protein
VVTEDDGRGARRVAGALDDHGDDTTAPRVGRELARVTDDEDDAEGSVTDALRVKAPVAGLAVPAAIAIHEAAHEDDLLDETEVRMQSSPGILFVPSRTLSMPPHLPSQPPPPVRPIPVSPDSSDGDVTEAFVPDPYDAPDPPTVMAPLPDPLSDTGEQWSAGPKTSALPQPLMPQTSVMASASLRSLIAAHPVSAPHDANVLPARSPLPAPFPSHTSAPLAMSGSYPGAAMSGAYSAHNSPVPSSPPFRASAPTATSEAPRAPRYGLLVTVVAIASLGIPVALYYALNVGQGHMPTTQPSEPASELERHDTHPRGKAPLPPPSSSASAASSSPPPKKWPRGPYRR